MSDTQFDQSAWRQRIGYSGSEYEITNWYTATHLKAPDYVTDRNQAEKASILGCSG
jgi:hypothetical protein